MYISYALILLRKLLKPRKVHIPFQCTTDQNQINLTKLNVVTQCQISLKIINISFEIYGRGIPTAWSLCADPYKFQSTVT
jgi:hypothetical protein